MCRFFWVTAGVYNIVVEGPIMAQEGTVVIRANSKFFTAVRLLFDMRRERVAGYVVEEEKLLVVRVRPNLQCLLTTTGPSQLNN